MTLSFHRLTLKESKYEIIGIKLLEFVSLCSNSGLAINSVFLKNKALEIAEKENIKDFRASNGYIDNFKKRNKFVLKIFMVTQMEDENLASEWLNIKLPKLLSDYEAKEIYI